MAMTDPIADMLTRIRNGLRNQRLAVDMPSSKVKLSLAEVLKREGYIKGFELVEAKVRNTLRIQLKYGDGGERVIAGLQRISRPGCRVYKGAAELLPYLNGLGMYVVSTPKGMLSDRECRTNKVGGEVLCSIW
jgi:small subunit ribosomal protein S8